MKKESTKKIMKDLKPTERHSVSIGNDTVSSSIAFMRDDIIQPKITSKPRFENADFRFYHELIPKAAMMKRIPR